MKKWIPVILIAGTLLGVSGYWYYSRAYDAARLVQMLPPDRSVHVYLNVKALRETGVLEMLAGSPAAHEADYTRFVEETGFDYRTDLDGVAAAFRDGDVYYAAQGRFQWEKLAAYAMAHGGSCEGPMCKLPGTVPGRDVSYYMPRNGVLALATSRASNAIEMVGLTTWRKPPVIPATGLWVSAPPYVFRNPENLPAGTRSFLSPLKDATETILMLGPAASGPAAFELRMEVTCATAEAAAAMHKQFTDATALLVNMLARENLQPNKDDLSGLLAGGKFEISQTKVTGTWPVDRALIDTMFTSGIEVPGAQ
jgi:hypothetical protein